MDRRFNFTKTAIKALPAPKNGKTTYYYDTDTRGLELIVTPKGRKTFYFYRKFRGNNPRIFIGPFPEMTIQSARGKASEYNACILAGVDPQGIGPNIRRGLTLKELFGEFLKRSQRPIDTGGKKTWKEDLRQFNTYLTSFHARKINSITRRELEELHIHVATVNGKYAANRVLALLRTLFNFAINQEFYDGRNPAKSVKMHQEKSRERRIENEEFPRLLTALRDEPNKDMVDIFFMLYLTGARKSNVLEMKWEDIDFEKETWVIENTKNGDRLVLPLAENAINILNQRRASARNEWVFPSYGSTGHITEIKTAWKRVIDRAGIVNLRIHDLRRTHASILSDQGVDLYSIGKSLGHRSLAATMVYARTDIDVIRGHKKIISKVLDSHLGEL